MFFFLPDIEEFLMGGGISEMVWLKLVMNFSFGKMCRYVLCVQAT